MNKESDRIWTLLKVTIVWHLLINKPKVSSETILAIHPGSTSKPVAPTFSRTCLPQPGRRPQLLSAGELPGEPASSSGDENTILCRVSAAVCSSEPLWQHFAPISIRKGSEGGLWFLADETWGNRNYFLGCFRLMLSSQVAVLGHVWSRPRKEVEAWHEAELTESKQLCADGSLDPSQSDSFLSKVDSQTWNENKDIPGVGICMNKSSDLWAGRPLTIFCHV